VLRIFIALKNPSPWPGFEPSTFGSSAQHTNHYTTKAMRICFQDIKKERSYETDIVDVIQVLLLFVCTG
jgi:hypothetical protein